MTTINQVTHAIMFGDFDNEQLDAVAQAIRYRRTQLSKEVKRSIAPGAIVKFYHPRQGCDITGTVNRIKQKYILVDTPQGRYNVPANLLEAV
jgi:ATP-dependent protease HslVU (ClpYQ) ATPase subunit